MPLDEPSFLFFMPAQFLRWGHHTPSPTTTSAFFLCHFPSSFPPVPVLSPQVDPFSLLCLHAPISLSGGCHLAASSFFSHRVSRLSLVPSLARCFALWPSVFSQALCPPSLLGLVGLPLLPVSTSFLSTLFLLLPALTRRRGGSSPSCLLPVLTGSLATGHGPGLCCPRGQ